LRGVFGQNDISVSTSKTSVEDGELFDVQCIKNGNEHCCHMEIISLSCQQNKVVTTTSFNSFA
jgi:hypothetical protein